MTSHPRAPHRQIDPRPAPTFCLTMIIRDESAGIVPTLEGAKALGIDRWCIVDTGSTDGTPQLVRDTLAGIPGTLHHRPWRNFAENRNESLELAKQEGTGWLLIMDADWKASGRVHPPARHSCGYIDVLLDGTTLRHPLVLRADKPWRFVGAVHEYLTCAEPGALEGPVLSGIAFAAGAYARLDEAFATRRLARLRWDLEVLGEQFERQGDARTALNIAQTYRALGQTEDAIAWYDRTMELSTSGEEAWYAAFMSGALQIDATSWAVSTAKLLHAWRMRPSRAEPLWELVAIYRQLGLHLVADYFEELRLRIPLPGPTERMVYLPAYSRRPWVQREGKRALESALRQEPGLTSAGVE